ncbi:MAG: hypothetical protein HZA61_01065 [Candidatus Eisenbacteria bacterium]|uniref:Uncharacterized protein n=1 Tax=Eiseniibacteriota bacterium TaxID=2212470 RepID=A0A933W0K5_UNCEI|nr:hypothetical protein [Candidatus Eisenbacteria bacterium]
MNPLLSERFRRQAPIAGSLLVLAVFLVAHAVLFGPLASRYRGALSQAGALGAILDPRGVRTPAMPPRVYTLLMDNSLPTAEADRRGSSGALGAELVQSLSGIATRHGLEVVVAEPGLLTQQETSVEARAHLRLRGSYAAFSGFLDDLSRGGKLHRVERFSMEQSTPGRCDIDLYVARLVLKRSGARS